jgi:uncharacterized protein YqhQ
MDIGGQAVIEGVLLRSPHYLAIAVRKPDGTITTKIQRFVSLTKRYRILNLPVIRGIVSLYEMLRIGIKALMYSGEVAADTEEKISPLAMILTVAVSLVFALGIFVALPYFLTTVAGFSEDSRPVIFNVIDGVIKIVLLIGYLYLISLMKDISAVFQYHGAEHKVVNCFEQGKPVTLTNANRYGTIHPRCGTSFIFIVIFIMILLFSLAPALVGHLFPASSTLPFWHKRLLLFGLRFLFLLPVVGISYELLKISSRYKDNWLVRILISPGLLIQRLSTKEPRKDQLEVAIAAIDALLKKEPSAYSGKSGRQPGTRRKRQ